MTIETARNQLLELANDSRAEMRGFACDVAVRAIEIERDICGNGFCE